MQKKGRADFLIERIQSAEDSGRVIVRLLPDPKRYSEVIIEGKRSYIDRYLKVLISEEQMCAHMQEVPLYDVSPTIGPITAYADSRLGPVASQLMGGVYTPPHEPALSHRRFESEQERTIAFLSVDICSSTAYRRKDAEGFERAYTIFMRELGALVGQFHGTILKTTGDGFIAYIDHPAYTRQCDLAVDLGLSLIVFCIRALNPALKEHGLKPLSIRVGADYGTAEIRKIEIPPIGFVDIEVASDALNRAVKIEQTCRPNQLRIGRDLYELLHVRWLERAEEIAFEASDVGIEGYKVYRVR